MTTTRSPSDAAMLAPSAAWDDAGASPHLVQFYDADAFLGDTVARFLGAGLAGGDAAVLIATPAHRTLVEAALRARGNDVDRAAADGRWMPLDAAALLRRIVVGDSPDERRFRDVVGGALTRARAGRRRRVHAFGEMVALLCAEGKTGAAIELEELWNRLGARRRFSLLCAYPMRAFDRETQAEAFDRICGAHARVLPTERYARLATPAERLRNITELQQQTTALAVERREAERSLDHAEAELDRKLAALADAERRRDEFLAMLGHELRNPLAAVRNAVVTARLDPARRKRALDIAHRQTEQLGWLIDDLLDVARVTRGRITLRRQRVGLGSIIEQAVEAVRPWIDDRGHVLSVSLPPEDVLLDADPARLEQILVNLLTNAAKYTEPGGRIDVTGGRQGDEAAVCVRDSGVGIPRDLLPSVFDLFTQATRDLDRAPGGLGIGLTLARRLVELHGGRIEARSDGLGHGAEFIVRVPALPTAADAALLPARADGRMGARILLVEDNPDAAESLCMLLQLLGHHVRVAHDGMAAIEVARVARPDLVLMDIGLPGIDGYEVARRVRRDPALCDVVLVALTGYGTRGDRERALAAGFHHHLVKPIDVEALEDVLARLAPQRAALH